MRKSFFQTLIILYHNYLYVRSVSQQPQFVIQSSPAPFLSLQIFVSRQCLTTATWLRGTRRRRERTMTVNGNMKGTGRPTLTHTPRATGVIRITNGVTTNHQDKKTSPLNGRRTNQENGKRCCKFQTMNTAPPRATVVHLQAIKKHVREVNHLGRPW